MANNDVLQDALTLDLSEPEQRLWESLPDVPARESMVRETSLEYRRWHVLRRLGSKLAPLPESLLARFVAFAGHNERVAADDGEPPTYTSLFGNQPTYPWRSAINVLCFGGPQPSTGGDSHEL